MSDDLQILLTPVEAILDLRWRILRAGLPRESACFPGDDDPATLHITALINQQIVGCASFMQNHWNDLPAWQLRGMAVEIDHQSRGIGAKMLGFADREILSRGYSTQLWCNARVPAMNFYLKHGWKIASEVFNIPTAGPHVKMTRMIADRSP